MSVKHLEAPTLNTVETKILDILASHGGRAQAGVIIKELDQGYDAVAFQKLLTPLCEYNLITRRGITICLNDVNR